MGIWEHVSCFITFTGKSKCHGRSGACSKPTHDKKWWTISRGKDNVGGFTPPRGCGFKHHCLPCSLSVSVLLQVALPLFDTSWYSYNQCKMFNWWLPVCFFTCTTLHCYMTSGILINLVGIWSHSQRLLLGYFCHKEETCQRQKQFGFIPIEWEKAQYNVSRTCVSVLINSRAGRK